MAAAVFALSVTPAAQAQETVIAALGDSLTQGYGLPQEQGFVPQLETWLRDQGIEARLINAGVSGDTSTGGLARIDWTLSDDVDAVIVTLGGNDLLRGIDPALTRENMNAIIAAAQEKGVRVLLIGMQAPGNYGPDYKAAFDAIYPELAQAHGTLFAHSFLAPLTGGDITALPPRALMQSDGIHPNAKGVEMIVQALGPKVIDLIKAQP